ncbi:MAG: Rrf2 family transcriptional regulator [Bifidobacterium sp.]|uniref:Rrf2 family transcriptional regulator n=1 Tax=Bifidobacterium fermentum TaxID=3059035 RepID=A0AB39UCS0_9BIFI
MKIRNSMEQSVCVLLMLAMERDHRPVKSHVLSTILGVSDAYLRKVMRRLVNSGLVRSDASKDGGYTLSRPIDQISMLDVFNAVEGPQPFFELSHLARRIFVKGRMVLRSENEVLQVISDAEDDFRAHLKGYPLSKALEGIQYHNGVMRWESKMGHMADADDAASEKDLPGERQIGFDTDADDGEEESPAGFGNEGEVEC